MQPNRTEFNKIRNLLISHYPDFRCNPLDTELWFETIRLHPLKKVDEAMRNCHIKYVWVVRPVLALIVKELMIIDGEWSEKDESDVDRLRSLHKYLTAGDWIVAASYLDAKYLTGYKLTPDKWDDERQIEFWDGLCAQLTKKQLDEVRKITVEEYKSCGN